MHKFACSHTGLSVAFTPKCVDALLHYRQKGCRKEAGGMLFSQDLESETVCISAVSLPGPGDVRRRDYFAMDERRAQGIIEAEFAKGYHYVGDWHTHPQSTPRPSQRDVRSINRVFSESQHYLRCVLLLILTPKEDFAKSFVGFADGNAVHECVKERLEGYEY
jgi:integrative and conjugative element protein (TIGR02256 family)